MFQLDFVEYSCSIRFISQFCGILEVSHSTPKTGKCSYDTYSPVTKLGSIQMILAFAARYNWDDETFDFIGAYFNGELEADEDIYMQAPPGYKDQAG
jgi:Reverse transcriptase (RNA-dependent DNA polymerase)